MITTEFVFIKNGIFVEVLKYYFAFIIEKYNHILRKINTALRPIIQMLVKTILACFCTLKKRFCKTTKTSNKRLQMFGTTEFNEL